MSGTKKVVILVVIVAIIVVVAAVLYGYMGNGPGGAVNTASPTNGGALSSSATRSSVPPDVSVPNKGATDTPANVAVPAIQGAGDPSGDVSYRSFNINADKNTFSPDTIIVNQGDTVNLEITAVDAAYEFNQPDYGFSVPIAQGKTQRIQFQALQSGDFTFYCASCGGPSRGPVGQIIVVSQK